MEKRKFDVLFESIITEITKNPNEFEQTESFVDLPPEEVCKDQGYVNECYYDSEFKKKFEAAKAAHEKMKLEHPEEHDEELKEYPGNYSCTHIYACKCGYSYKVDSSRIIYKLKI